MDPLHSLGIALVIALASVFSAFGVGFLTGFLLGTNTHAGRTRAVLAGLITMLVMMFCQVWLAHNGYRL